MEWEPDTSVGEWLRERLDDPWLGTMHDVVPRGFEAYARVFHPASVTELPGERMPAPDDVREMPWHQHEALFDRMVTSAVTWAQTAAAFGTTFHAGAQWNRLVRSPGDALGDANGWQQVIGPDGREYNAPPEGDMDPGLVARLAGILREHTTAATEGHIAQWEGIGGLVGHLGHSPSRAFLQIGDRYDDDLAKHNRMLGAATRDVFNDVFRRKTWQDGILSREVSEGPRFDLPGRPHVLFRGGIDELAAPDWVLDAPWRDRPAEEHGFDPSAHAPSIVWPADRAWVWVTEVDYDSTIVGGSTALVQSLCAADGIEALPIGEGTTLTYFSDEVNA